MLSILLESSVFIAKIYLSPCPAPTCSSLPPLMTPPPDDNDIDPPNNSSSNDSVASHPIPIPTLAPTCTDLLEDTYACAEYFVEKTLPEISDLWNSDHLTTFRTVLGALTGILISKVAQDYYSISSNTYTAASAALGSMLGRYGWKKPPRKCAEWANRTVGAVTYGVTGAVWEFLNTPLRVLSKGREGAAEGFENGLIRFRCSTKSAGHTGPST